MAKAPASKSTPTPTPMTAAQEDVLRGAGAGHLSDIARMAKNAAVPVSLTVAQAAAAGAGFVQDVLRSRGSFQLPPLFSAAVVSIANATQPTVVVGPYDYPRFPVNSVVHFAGTGSPILDAIDTTFTVVSVNAAALTFKISADLRGTPAPVTRGTIFLQ